MARARTLAGLLALGALCAALPAAAASTPNRPIVMALVDRSGSALTVTETVAAPGRGNFFIWPGAHSATVLAGLASIAGSSFTVPPGVQSAQVSYSVPFHGGAMTIRWPFPTSVETLWLLVGNGVRLPVILNQKFYPAPATVWNGRAYSVYSARNVGGVLLLNLQAATSQASLWQRMLPYLWLAPVLLVAYLILRRLRRRAHA